MSSPVFRIVAVLALVTLVGWGCTQKAPEAVIEPVGTIEPALATSTATGTLSAAVDVQQPVQARQTPPSANTLTALRQAVTGATEPAKTVKNPETYQKALGTYQYRIQFLNCQANPSTIALKAGMPIMLDNRDSEKHTFKLGKQSFSVLGYDYVIAKAPTPGTYTIICDGGGAAELQVQG